MNIAYVRVSTIEQNPGRQYEDLKKFNIDKWYEEKASAKNTDRPVLNEMLSFARDGDTIYIESFSRLARNTADLLRIIDDLEKNNVKIISQKENLDSKTPTGKMMITMIGAIATFERELILERQREGIALAKAAGKYKGRTSMKAPPNFKELYEAYMNRQIKTKKDLAKACKCSYPILMRFIRELSTTKRD
ncbi:MAG: recombinase family protein [Blautia sp.]|nr:recombinase family protein [Blautia sp.]